MNKKTTLTDLTQIPGVGKAISADLINIGINSIAELKGKDPEMLYQDLNNYEGKVQDRCVLYVFRCAVYYAETKETDREADLLRWWNWKARKK